MLTRLIDFVVGREPVATATGIAGVVTATFGLLHAFDILALTPEQVAAVGTFLAVVAGWAARRVVTPVTKLGPLPADNGETAGVGVALLVAVVGIVVVGWLVGDACIDDASERDDLGAPAWVADRDDDRREDDEEESDEGRRCAAFVVVVCGDLIVPIPDPGQGGET